ncbi:MAG: hypothetical protein Q9223_007711, partial [Gallowayella weberi]
LAPVMEKSGRPEAHCTGASTNKADAIKNEKTSNDRPSTSVTSTTSNETQRLGMGGSEEYTNEKSSVLLQTNHEPASSTEDDTGLYQSTGHDLDLNLKNSRGLMSRHPSEGANGNDLVTSQTAPESSIESINNSSRRKAPASMVSIMVIHPPGEKRFMQMLRLDTAASYNLITRKRVLDIEKKIGAGLPLQNYSGEAVTLMGREVLPRFQVTLDWHVLGRTITRTHTFLIDEEHEDFQLLLRRQDLDEIGFLFADQNISNIRNPLNLE